MAGVRGSKSAFPNRGSAPTGIFSTKGRQKKDPIVGDFKSSMTAKAMDKPRKGPVKRDNRIK